MLYNIKGIFYTKNIIFNMKKTLFYSVFATFLVLLVPVLTHADSALFTTSLSYGSQNRVEVVRLQEFLISQGFLHTTATGNFLTLTQAAVVDFQKTQGIDPVGIFGPLTRAAANKIVLAQGTPSTPVASVSLKSVSSSNSGAGSILLANQKTITWQTSNYPAGVGIDINLIKKVSDNPRSFVFVRKIATDTANDGKENWIPQSGETANTMYIELACSTSHQFPGGCKTSSEPTPVN